MGNRFNRDTMFYRLASLDIGLENTEDILNDLKKVSNPDFQDLEGNSYLHMACQSHSAEAVSILLDLGANPNINNNKGLSPILRAIGMISDNNNEILELMLQHGLDLDKTEGNMTLREQIELFDDDNFRKIIEKYNKNK